MVPWFFNSLQFYLTWIIHPHFITKARACYSRTTFATKKIETFYDLGKVYGPGNPKLCVNILEVQYAAVTFTNFRYSETYMFSQCLNLQARRIHAPVIMP